MALRTTFYSQQNSVCVHKRLSDRI